LFTFTRHQYLCVTIIKCKFALMFLVRLSVVLTLLILFSCKENPFGFPVENKAPETYSVTDTIIRYGDNRFTTTITVSWWGDDPDGYIAGYELSVDKLNWEFTTKKDSSFTVKLPQGTDTLDFVLYIRSVDNRGLKDPNPAFIYYPVKNSPPAISFVYPSGNPARKPISTFPVIRFSWSASDPDGDDNISHYEVFINDTTNQAIVIDHVYKTIILEAVDLIQNIVDCNIYQGNNLNVHPQKISGLKLNSLNELLIRAVDKVGEKSPIEKSYSIFVRKPQSTTLLVNAYSSSIETREDFYKSNLNACGITNFDILRVNEITGSQYTQLSADNATQEKVFALFENIIWFGKDIDYSMSLAQKTTSAFFNNGGKMFMAVEIASSIDDQAGYLDFSPVDSLVSLPKGVNNFRIETDSVLIPAISGWPVLKSTKISNARPFYEEQGAISLYDAKLVKTGSFGKAAWEGKSTVMAKKLDNNGSTNFIICSLELHNVNGNSNMVDLFSKIFKDELKIK